jgi:hypothetical protein
MIFNYVSLILVQTAEAVCQDSEKGNFFSERAVWFLPITERATILYGTEKVNYLL